MKTFLYKVSPFTVAIIILKPVEPNFVFRGKTSCTVVRKRNDGKKT